MKTLVLISVLVLTVLQPGAAQNSSQDFELLVRERGVPVEPGITDRPVRIAFATPLQQVSDYWRRSIDSFTGRMDEIGLPYRIFEFSTRVDQNRKLRQAIQSAMSVNPDYIVVTLNDYADEQIVSRLLINDSPKVIIQNVTRPLDIWHDNPPFLYVGFDHAAGTEKLAEEYIRRFSGRENIRYAVLYHIEGNLVSRYRGDHFIDEISRATAFSLVAEYYTEGDRESSRRAAAEVLSRNSELDFIYACATDIAFGALDALKEDGRAGRVVVNGWGGGAAELEAVQNGELGFTVMRMNDDNGAAMAEAVRMDLEGRDPPLVYSGDMLIITGEEDRNYIEELKSRSFRYSGD